MLDDAKGGAKSGNALTHTEIQPIDNKTGYRSFQAGSFAEDPINGYDFTTERIINQGVMDSGAVKLFNQHM